jgi:hypothetical protein
MFDFVRDVIPLSVELDFADIVEDVLKETLTRNTSKNFRAWFEKIKWGHDYVPVEQIYMNFDVDDLDVLFSDFHSLDHAHHHKVWGDVASRILYQFKRMFLIGVEISQLDFVFEKEFRTLRKYVPSILDYMNRFYKPREHRVYRLRRDDDG